MIGDERLYRAVHDPTGHLAEAGNGGFLGAVLNNQDNTLMGQARFFEVDPEELFSSSSGNHDGGGLSPVLIAAAAAAVGILATVVVVKTAPTVQSWWLATARPGLQGFWARLTKRQSVKTSLEQPSLLELASPVDPAKISSEIAIVVKDDREVMSSSEAQQRHLALMLAVAFAAEQLRILKDARVEDPEKLQELRRAASQLSTQESVNLANRMLEANESLLDVHSQAMFVSIFGGGQTTEGKYMPLERHQIEKAMRFPEQDHS